MELTERYKLKKPGQDDYYDVQDFNDNADAIDAALGQHDKDIAEVFRVGDIRSTLRTDLGDDWLLCNGEAFDPAEYPQLAEVIPGGLAAMGTKAKTRTIGTSPGSNFRLGAYATDGTNQLAAYANDNTSSSSGGSTNSVYWSNNNFKTYTTKTIQSSATRIRLFFANGHWIVFAGSYENLNYCYTADEPFVSFPTKTNLITNPSVQDILHVEYADGIYYAFCVTYDPSSSTTEYSLSVLSSVSADFSNCTVTTAASKVGGSSSKYSFCRTEDKYVFFVYSENGIKISRVAWANSPAGPYQTKGISPTTQAYVRAWTPVFVDGKFVWVGAQSTSPYTQTLVCLENLEDSEITYVKLGFAYASGSHPNSRLVDCGDGIYAFFVQGEKYIHLAEGSIFQASSWTRASLNVAPDLRQCGLVYTRDGTVNVSTSGGVLSIPHGAVPSVSISNCYTYIKAK